MGQNARATLIVGLNISEAVGALNEHATHAGRHRITRTVREEPARGHRVTFWGYCSITRPPHPITRMVRRPSFP